MGKQEIHVEGIVDTDVASIIKLVGVKIPTLDDSLGQHQGWPSEFCGWK